MSCMSDSQCKCALLRGPPSLSSSPMQMAQCKVHCDQISTDLLVVGGWFNLVIRARASQLLYCVIERTSIAFFIPLWVFFGLAKNNLSFVVAKAKKWPQQVFKWATFSHLICKNTRGKPAKHWTAQNTAFFQILSYLLLLLFLQQHQDSSKTSPQRHEKHPTRCAHQLFWSSALSTSHQYQQSGPSSLERGELHSSRCEDCVCLDMIRGQEVVLRGRLEVVVCRATSRDNNLQDWNQELLFTWMPIVKFPCFT